MKYDRIIYFMNRRILLLSFLIILSLGYLIVKTSIEHPVFAHFSNFNIQHSHELIKAMYSVDPTEARESLDLKIITLNYDGEISTKISRSSSPILAVIDLGYPLSNRNILISTSPITSLHSKTYIKVESYTSTIDEITMDIPFQILTTGSSLCSKMKAEEIQQKGVLGVKTQRIKRIYKGEKLIAEEIIDETIIKQPVPQIAVIKGPNDSPDAVPQRGYNCAYWEAYIDNINASAEEKQWLKFTMRLESGCNAESNKSYYKGLFQWDPCLWYKIYPNDNIFDGEKQISRTLEKVRAGANPKYMWPAVYRKYVSVYGPLSWLQ